MHGRGDSSHRERLYNAPMATVGSKGIRWIRYDERSRTLDVAFPNSGEYRYFDVGPEVYAWLMKAESKGKFINRLVKERYRYERLEGESGASEQPDLEQLLRESLNSNVED
jgi:hypothetical protein